MKLIYENPLSTPEDVKDFVLEGKAVISFENGRLRMENQLSEVEGQKANYVYWCDREFPENIRIEWGFLPVREPGLAMMFFAAKGRDGEDIFDPSLDVRNGEYKMYHHGDIDAFHVSYFRRKEPDENIFTPAICARAMAFTLWRRVRTLFRIRVILPHLITLQLTSTKI